jgi:predicted phosphodiesterase
LKVSILADIHGNGVALRAALGHARAIGASQLVVLGDIVGYYYGAKEALQQLRTWPLIAIRGNHERMFAEALHDPASAERYRSRYGSALAVAGETLSAEEKAWLLGLPDRATTDLDGVRLELCHGSPRDPDEYVYPDAATQVLDACVVPDRDFVLMGHTHRPMIAVRGTTALVNPGSVGQARDLGGLACWCLLDTATGTLQFQRTPYDASGVAAEVRRRDPHLPDLADVLMRSPSQPAKVTVAAS